LFFEIFFDQIRSGHARSSLNVGFLAKTERAASVTLEA
jgi:hypothetical protein